MPRKRKAPLEEIKLDMSKASKQKERAKARETPRWFEARKKAFMDDGFTDEEAEWGARHMALRWKRVQAVRKKRRDIIKFWVRKGKTKKWAIREASRVLKDKLKELKLKDKELWYETS